MLMVCAKKTLQVAAPWTLGNIMLAGRIIGWLMIGVAALMASADAVMALGPNDYDSILTADVVTLLTGNLVAGHGGWSQALQGLMTLPAWIVVGAGGLAAVLLCRKRHPRRFRFRRA